jgi:hypothetical protein
MTKCGRSGKIRIFSFLLQNIRFQQFQNRKRTRAKLEDLKIQGVLNHGKRLRSTKEPRWKKSKPKIEATKIRVSGLGYRSIQFFLN